MNNLFEKNKQNLLQLFGADLWLMTIKLQVTTEQCLTSEGKTIQINDTITGVLPNNYWKLLSQLSIFIVCKIPFLYFI